jgi:hypothetical protein
VCCPGQTLRSVEVLNRAPSPLAVPVDGPEAMRGAVVVAFGELDPACVLACLTPRTLGPRVSACLAFVTQATETHLPRENLALRALLSPCVGAPGVLTLGEGCSCVYGPLRGVYEGMWWLVLCVGGASLHRACVRIAQCGVYVQGCEESVSRRTYWGVGLTQG